MIRNEIGVVTKLLKFTQFAKKKIILQKIVLELKPVTGVHGLPSPVKFVMQFSAFEDLNLQCYFWWRFHYCHLCH